MTEYRQVIIETYRHEGGGSKHSIRARPIPGQGLDHNMNVECSSSMRKKHPIGSKILIQAKITDREDGAPFLYTYHRWPYKLLCEDEVISLLNSSS